MGSSTAAQRATRPRSTKQPPIVQQAASCLPPREVIEQRLGLLGDRLTRIQGIIGTVLTAANQLEDRSGEDGVTDLRCALEVAYELLAALDYDYITGLLRAESARHGHDRFRLRDQRLRRPFST
jgi:hypothetical protein